MKRTFEEKKKTFFFVSKVLFFRLKKQIKVKIDRI